MLETEKPHNTNKTVDFLQLKIQTMADYSRGQIIPANCNKFRNPPVSFNLISEQGIETEFKEVQSL